MVLENIDYYAKELQDMLVSKTYSPSPYIEEILKDGNSKKERLIYKPKFYPDQCIHWALMQVIEGPLSKGMYQYTCGSIPKRGTHYARKYVKRCINRDPKHTKYVLQIDISKFYPSIDHDCLKKMLRDRFKDPDALWLLDSIIDSAETGLPIGNYTSQWLANFYLQNFDHYIKQKLGVKHYVRYMDDCVFMGNNKKKLHIVRLAIKEFLLSIGLKLKHNWQVYRLDCRPLDFVGFRFFRTHILMRKRNALRIRRRVSKMHKKGYYAYRDCAALVSYFGWLKYSNSYNFYKKNVGPYVDINKMKEVISNESKKQCYAPSF
jgi:retron-type reverse transcriptase